MRWTARLRAFSLGLAVAAAVQFLQLAPAENDLKMTLRVGDISPARPFIESELGPVPVARGAGHDGQYNYLVARDPFGLEGLAGLTDHGGYRFRRVLLGWLAGGFGLLPPRATLLGLSFWAAVGFGLAAAAAAELGSLLGARRWAILAVITCLGAWLSLQLVTSDTLALGFALVGLALLLRERFGAAAVAISGAALAKEVYLAFALAGALWLIGQRRIKAALLVGLAPAAVLAAWIAWLDLRIGSGWSPKGNLAPPLAGMISSIASWEPSGETVLGVVALASLFLGVIGAWLSRHLVLIWPVALWTMLAMISSELVWGGGNNAVRVLAPLWCLGLLGVAVGIERSQGTTSRRAMPRPAQAKP